MKLSISNIAWGKDNDTEMYKYISKEGYDAIEIAPTRILEEKPYEKLEEAEEFAKTLKDKYKLNISSMQSIWYGKTEKIFASKEERKELIEYTKKAIDFANIINCGNLVFGCPKNRNINTPEDYDVAIEFFKEIGEYAKLKNTIFSIEPNPTIYNTNFINKTEEAFEFVKKIDSEGIKVNVDLGTVIENNEDIIEILENNYDKVNHIHISEPNLETIQQREIHKQLAQKLKENNYQKYISIEMKNKNNIENVKEIIKYVKGVFE